MKEAKIYRPWKHFKFLFLGAFLFLLLIAANKIKIEIGGGGQCRVTEKTIEQLPENLDREKLEYLKKLEFSKKELQELLTGADFNNEEISIITNTAKYHPISQYIIIIMEIFVSLISLWMFIYTSKRKILLSREGIENIEINSLNPFKNKYKNQSLSEINWKEIKKLKFIKARSPLRYYILNEEKKFLYLNLANIEKGI